MNSELTSVSPARPKAVTTVALLMIIFAALAWVLLLWAAWILDGATGLKSTVLSWEWAVISVFTFAQVVLGLGLLRGKEVARICFFWVIPVVFLFDLLWGQGLHTGLFFQVGWYSVFSYLLTRPASSNFFWEVSSASLQPTSIPKPAKRVVASPSELACPVCAEPIPKSKKWMVGNPDYNAWRREGFCSLKCYSSGESVLDDGLIGGASGNL